MALVWRCDRCKRISEAGIAYEDGDGENERPTGWERRILPVRGSKGARSDGRYLLCTECDDDLYRWFHDNAQATDAGGTDRD